MSEEEIPNSELTPEEEKRLEEEIEKKKLKTPKQFSWKSLYEAELSPIEYYIDHLLINRGTTFFGGPSGSFKTNFLLYMVGKAVLGEDVLKFKTNKPMKVLWIDEENGARVMQKKVRQICDSNGIDPKKVNGKVIFRCMTGLKINESGIRELERHINAYSVNIIVIDNIVRCLDGDENDAKEVRKLENLLKRLKEERGISFIIIHHLRKPPKEGQDIGLHELRGSGDFAAQCDNIFIVAHDKYNTTETQKSFTITQVKCRDQLEMPEQFFVVRDGLKIINLGEKKEILKAKMGNCAMEILDLFTKDEYMKTREIVKEMIKKKYSDKFVRMTLKNMCKAGQVSDDKYGYYRPVSPAKTKKSETS